MRLGVECESPQTLISERMLNRVLSDPPVKRCAIFSADPRNLAVQFIISMLPSPQCRTRAASSELIWEAAMTRPLTDATIFHFGNFEFDAGTFELRREGSRVRLQSQPAQVLALLLENHERTVSREELKSAIWGEATFVDFERGLNFCVSQVRSALQDSSMNSLYVRTIPKNGYRFVAPLTRSVHSATEESLQSNAPRRFSLFTRGTVI
jgi:DNA-binding winged helix-turn-helix (wHTH) protein